jgi:hypothetical protein
MPQDDSDRSEVFQSLVQAWDKDEAFFSGLYGEYDEESSSVGGLRRRRRRASNTPDDPIKTVSLIQKDGVLLWCDDIPEGKPSSLDIGPRRRRLRRRAGLSVPPVVNPPEMKDGPLGVDQDVSGTGSEQDRRSSRHDRPAAQLRPRCIASLAAAAIANGGRRHFHAG